MMSTLFPGAIRNPVFKRILLSLLFIYLGIVAFSQEIRITCSDEPLNKILITLLDNYGLMLSFDDKQLSNYKLTVDKKFTSPVQVFDYLLKGLPLGYEISDGVYVIYSVQIKEKPKRYIITGRITDKTNHETLPFSSILVNNAGFFSDAKGNFSSTSTSDSIFKIKISYLGYYILDTVLASGTNYNLKLTPSVIAMEEVVITGSTIARTIQTGTSPGIARLNHKIAYFPVMAIIRFLTC